MSLWVCRKTAPTVQEDNDEIYTLLSWTYLPQIELLSGPNQIGMPPSIKSFGVPTSGLWKSEQRQVQLAYYFEDQELGNHSCLASTSWLHPKKIQLNYKKMQRLDLASLYKVCM